MNSIGEIIKDVAPTMENKQYIKYEVKNVFKFKMINLDDVVQIARGLASKVNRSDYCNSMHDGGMLFNTWVNSLLK